MLILQKNWDEGLFKVFCRLNVFAVTGRSGHDFSISGSKLIASKLTGREYPLGNTNILGRILGKFIAISKPYWIYKYWSPTALRLSVNRGPLMIRHSLLKQLDYLDETFAPFELDDLDLCCRAFKKFNLKSASQPIYYKEIGGSKANSLASSEISISSIEKNTQHIIQRHSDLVSK
jgi:GT2 family glycosyltransferase